MLDGDAQDADVLDADILDTGAGLRAETLELWVEKGIIFARPTKCFTCCLYLLKIVDGSGTILEILDEKR